jgi:FMN phosphatase YigB (HAD superfamily)
LLDGLGGHFVRVFSSISDYGQLKNPQFYAWVCQEMGVEPLEMVHIGDSQRFDLIAAKEAGIRAFHLNRDEESVDPEALRSLAELESLV